MGFHLIKLALLSMFAMLAGCAMAGPGVGSISNPGARPTTYDNSWVNKPENETGKLNDNPQLSADISERELGVSAWFDNDGSPTTPRQPGYIQRQQERQAERRAAMKERMGITNIKDEQK